MSKSINIANIVFNSFTNDSRVWKESISLSKNGYRVEVIAHGDRDLKEKEQNDSFKIVRLNYLDRKIVTSKFYKLKIYLFWIKDVIKYVKNFDILHCNDLNTLPIAFIVKKFINKEIKIVYDSHEFAINEIPNENKFSIKIKFFLEKFLIKYVDRVITVSNTIANEYKKLYNIEKPSIILNTPPYIQKIGKKELFRKKLNIEKDKIIFLYQGGLSSGRGIEILIDTFKNINNPKIVIIFMGYGELEDTIKEAQKKYKNIYFYPAVSPDILLDYTNSADFGISTIEDSCLSYRYCLPNKMFEYIMAEIPLIVSNLPEMKKIIEDYKIGIIAKENSPSGLKEAIKKAVKLNKKELTKNIQKVKKNYNWEEQEKVLLKLYKELAL